MNINILHFFAIMDIVLLIFICALDGKIVRLECRLRDYEPHTEGGE